MNYLKMLMLPAVAAAVLMAFASTAAATTVTAPAGTTYTGHFEASSENGHLILHASNGVTIECGGFLTGSLTAHGPAATASGPISHLTFPNCTGGDLVNVSFKGTLEAHAIGSGNATLTSNGMEITTTDGATGVSCEYSTTNTDIGVLTGAPAPTGHGTLDINSAKMPRTGDSILCGATATWTGFYKFTTPTGLTFD